MAGQVNLNGMTGYARATEHAVDGAAGVVGDVFDGLGGIFGDFTIPEDQEEEYSQHESNRQIQMLQHEQYMQQQQALQQQLYAQQQQALQQQLYAQQQRQKQQNTNNRRETQPAAGHRTSPTGARMFSATARQASPTRRQRRVAMNRPNSAAARLRSTGNTAVSDTLYIFALILLIAFYIIRSNEGLWTWAGTRYTRNIDFVYFNPICIV